ncbi:MAG: hypothetical protein HQM07_08370 [Zetaproteobacteria bacterium]|nr:hypothetical protein [Zetaproteobacteria bacterium]
MKEIILYSISACASLVVLGYTVHIFIGGLVSEETETFAIIAAVILGIAVMATMAWDVLRRRRGNIL